MAENNRFGQGHVTELDRKLAATEIEHARCVGEYDEEEAARRLAKVRTVTTHAALRMAVVGGAGSVAPPVLEAAPRVVGAVWLLVSVVDVIVWLFIGLISGEWSPLWLILVFLGGGVLFFGVRGARNWDRRMRTGVDTP